MFGIRPKIIMENGNKNNTLGVARKWGSGWQSAPLELKRWAPCTSGFLGAKENLPPGWYTHRYARADCSHFWVKMEDVQTDIGEGVGPSLRVGYDKLWASLGPPLTYMYIPGVQNVESMGAKVWREEHFISTKCKAFPYWQATIKNRKSSKVRKNTHHRSLVRVWGTCSWIEGGVFMYRSKQSEEHCPKTLMSQGSRLTEAAVVEMPSA